MNWNSLYVRFFDLMGAFLVMIFPASIFSLLVLLTTGLTGLIR